MVPIQLSGFQVSLFIIIHINIQETATTLCMELYTLLKVFFFFFILINLFSFLERSYFKFFITQVLKINIESSRTGMGT